MGEGYEDIEKLTTKQDQMLDNALQQQQDIVNRQTELNVAELQRNKEDIDKDVDKTNKALYSEYRKQSNPYGANAENLASRGLGNSGYAETTQTNLYNTYQKNITDTLSNARKLKSDFDFQIQKARETGNITLAQNTLDIYKQKMQLLTEEYELKNNREQFLYKKSQDALSQANWEKEWARQQQRDAVSDDQWNKQFAYQQNRDAISDNQWNQTFNYQKERDAVSDDQWLKEYELSKKASTSRRSSSRSTSSSSGKNGLEANNGETTQAKSLTKEILNNADSWIAKNKDVINIAKNSKSETNKQRAIDDLDKMLSMIEEEYRNGLITEQERNNAMYIFDYR